MKWVDRYNSLSLLTVQTAILAFCFADGAFALAAAASVVVGVAWMLRSRNPPAAFPKVVVNLLVLVAIVHAALSSGASNTGHAVVSDLGEFLVYVQLIKLFDRRAHRDETQCLTLSLFVVIAAILTSNSLSVGVLLVIYAPMIVGAAMLAQIRQGQWRTGAANAVGSSTWLSRRGLLKGVPRPAPVATGTNPRDKQRTSGSSRIALASPHGIYAPARSVADRQFVRLCLRSTLMISVVAAVVFVFAPRGVGENNLGSFGVVRQTTIGYTETVKLGQSGLLTESPRPVLDMLVTDQDGRNVGLGRIFYLRGDTKDLYIPNGRIWSSNVPESPLPPPPQQQTSGSVTKPLRGNARTTSYLVQRITLRAPSRQQSRLFTLWRPSSVSFEQEAQFAQDPQDNSLLYSALKPGRLTYTVVSAPNAVDELDRPTSRPSVAVPRIHEIAAEVLRAHKLDGTQDVSDPAVIRQIAAAFRDHFQSDFVYTTDLPAPPGNVDPIVWFLDTSKRGHCEYYASAMTTMLQSVGVSARLVTGYVAGEFNTLTGEYVVRESNAHAWVEVHVGDGRWLTYDPTPGNVVERLHQPSGTIFSQLRQWYDMIEFNWSASIVGFDQFKQDRLFGTSLNTRNLLPSISDWLDRTGEWAMSRLHINGLADRVPPALIPLLPLILLVAISLYWLSMWATAKLGKIAPHRSASDPELAAIMRQSGFYPEALRHLDHAGARKPSTRPPLTHAKVLNRSQHAGLAEPLTVIAALFYRLRFGRHPLTADELRAAHEATDRLHQEGSGRPTKG